MHEKRAHARIAAPLHAVVVVGTTETDLAVRDVSLGGLFLYCRMPPGKVGTPVFVKLAVTAGIRPLTLRGEIVRIVFDPADANGKTVLGFGVEFALEGPEQKSALAALLDRAMLGTGTMNRAFPRVYRLLEVTCRTQKELKALMRDIGEGGVGLAVDRLFAVGDAVTVEIGRAGAGTLKLPGWVVSSASSEGGPGSFRVGVRFGKLAAPVRKELKLFLENLYRR